MTSTTPLPAVVLGRGLAAAAARTALQARGVPLVALAATTSAEADVERLLADPPAGAALVVTGGDHLRACVQRVEGLRSAGLLVALPAATAPGLAHRARSPHVAAYLSPGPVRAIVRGVVVVRGRAEAGVETTWDPLLARAAIAAARAAGLLGLVSATRGDPPRCAAGAPDWMGLTPSAGVDLAWLAYADAVGLPTTTGRARDGVRWPATT